MPWRSMAGEKKTPLDLIRPEDQAGYLPAFNALLATQVSEADAEARLREQEWLLEAHKQATEELTNYSKKWSGTSLHPSGGRPQGLQDKVAATLEAYTESMKNCTQQAVRPKSIEVTIDPALERIAVACTVTNPTSKCGEMHVSLPTLEGWGYLFSEERVADYPRTETCELKAKAERIFKEANAAANTGASITKMDSRDCVARAFKCPAGDTAWVWADTMNHEDVKERLKHHGADPEYLGQVIVPEHIPKVKDFYDGEEGKLHPKPSEEYLEYMREQGLDYRSLELDSKMGLPVVEAQVKYRQPARFDDELEIETWIGQLNRAKLRFDSIIRRGDTLVAFAEITLCCIELPEGKLRSMPPEILQLKWD